MTVKESLTITKHATERYAERIMNKDSPLEINKFIATNPDKINTDIRSMLEHSDLIYSGKVGTKDNSPVNVYLSGTWVLLLDNNNEKVITIYKIDFNVGEDFNKEFVNRILAKVREHQQSLVEKKKELDERKSQYEDIIKQNTAAINEHKNIIKRLEQTNADYQSVISDIYLEYNQEELKLKHDIEDLVLRKEF